MKCVRSCGRKAAPGHRACKQCHERSLARQDDGVRSFFHKERKPVEHQISRGAQAERINAMMNRVTKKP
jgi:cytochrome c553